MPDRDDQGAGREIAAAGQASAGGAKTAPSRRAVLRSAAGAGAAGIAVTSLGSVVGGVAARASTTTHDAAAGQAGGHDAAGSEPIVLHVRDAAAGEIDLFRGTNQTRLHDRDLAARIVRASR
jgi:hypothetical protein